MMAAVMLLYCTGRQDRLAKSHLQVLSTLNIMSHRYMSARCDTPPSRSLRWIIGHMDDDADAGYPNVESASTIATFGDI